MKFQDMPYARPDFDHIKAELTRLTEVIKTAPDAQTADKAYREVDALEGNLDTQYSLAYVRHQIDTTDAFYDAENTFYDENLPLLREAGQAVQLALFHSPFRPELEKLYGTLMFQNIEIELRTFSPEIVPDMQEENRLGSEYDNLLASAQIPFEGDIYTLAQLGGHKEAADDERRLAAWKAEAGFYVDNGAKLDALYADLVTVRSRMAKTLGYDSYVKLGYDQMCRNSYNREDVDRYRAAIVKHIVPVADRLMRQQAERIGVSYPLNFADAALTFRSGNAKPQGTPDDILAHGKAFYHELSPKTAEFIDFLYENELLDVLSRKGKAGGGFCTTFTDYKSPFIFANFNGTAGDVEVITHEAGHAFAAYTARDIAPRCNQSPTMESCEIHSMSMEFFAWPWAEGFFGSDTDKFLYGHLAGALRFLPYGTMVDHFQHTMYDHPEFTPEERHGEWKRLLAIYMPWIKLADIPFYGEGKGWQRQMHIYQRPFYYIDYCLAQTVSLQFWAAMQQNVQDAWKRYDQLVQQAGTKTFSGLVEAAGLESPFGDDALKTVAEAAVAWLDGVDLAKIK